MKLTDLMHGDWFNSPKGTCQINEIKLFTAIVEFSDEAYQTNGNVSATELDFEYQLEPIPITTEILKANDFEKITTYFHDHYRRFVNSSPVYLEKSIGDQWEVSIYQNGKLEMYIKHVHELQHILRLQGLTDFADQFKVKGDEK